MLVSKWIFLFWIISSYYHDNTAGASTVKKRIVLTAVSPDSPIRYEESRFENYKYPISEFKKAEDDEDDALEEIENEDNLDNDFYSAKEISAENLHRDE